MPNLESSEFVGRSAELEDLHGLLVQSEQVAIVAATGMGGIGKTRLAWEYAQHYRESYPGVVWWMDAKVEDTTDNADLQSEFVQQLLAYGSRMEFQELPDNLGSTEQQAQWCYDQWLAKQPQGNRLLVIDDLRGQSAYGQVKLLWPRDDRFRVLLTTRTRFSQPVQCLSLEVLKPSASLRLLRTLVADDQRIKHELIAAKKLCAWVGHLPLGLELVGRHLEKRPNLTIAKLLERLEEKRLAAKAAREVPAEMPYEDNIEAAFELGWQPLSDQAKTLASLLSVFALAPIPKTLIEMSLEDWDEEDLEDALDLELVGNSLLLDLGNGQYILHTLIHQFIGAKLETELQTEADNLRRSAALAVTHIAKRIPDPLTLVELEEVQSFIPHLTVIANHWTYLLPKTELIAPLEGLARINKSQCLWSEAEKWYTKALDLAERCLGAEHIETGTRLNNLANLYHSMGCYRQAEPLLMKALEICTKHGGEEHPITGKTLNNLAALYQTTGCSTAAEPLFIKALEISSKNYGEDHPITGAHINNLAGLYYSMDEYDKAKPLFNKSLEISSKNYGEDHPITGTRLNNLAELHLSIGNYCKAEPLLMKALAISENYYGEDHPTTGTRLNNLAELYYLTEQNEKAGPLFEKALKISRKQLGEEHLETGKSLQNLAEFYRSTERNEKAGPLFEKALKISRKQLGEGHLETGKSLQNLAEFYRSTEQYNKARPLFEKALKISEKQFGPRHQNTGISLNNLANFYASINFHSEAEALYLKAIQILVNALGQDHPSTQAVVGNFYAFCQTVIEGQQTDLLSDQSLTQHIVQEIHSSRS